MYEPTSQNQGEGIPEGALPAKKMELKCKIAIIIVVIIVIAICSIALIREYTDWIQPTGELDISIANYLDEAVSYEIFFDDDLEKSGNLAPEQIVHHDFELVEGKHEVKVKFKGRTSSGERINEVEIENGKPTLLLISIDENFFP